MARVLERGQRYTRFATSCLLTVPLLAPTVSTPAAGLGPVPPRLAGTYVAQLPNYPGVGLYAGRYKLKFGPGATVRYSVPGEGSFTLGVTVSRNRITFLPGKACLTRGTYIWNIQGKILTFKKVKDPCPRRAITMVRRWTQTA